jgi:hypothetical protein
MKASAFDRRRKVRLISAVLAVGLVVSALLAAALVYMARMHL